MRLFLLQNGIKHIKSAPYHPASNGEAERAVRMFKTTMKKLKGTLNQRLVTFLLYYRSTPHSTTQKTPAELFLGRRLRTRLDCLKPDMERAIAMTASRYVSGVPCTFKQGDQVLVRDYHARQEKWLPGVVQYENRPVTYGVNVNGSIWKRHVDQLKQQCSPKPGMAQIDSGASQEVEQQVDALTSV